jgi:hypothetical protein
MEEGASLKDPRYDIREPADLPAQPAARQGAGADGVTVDTGKGAAIVRTPPICDEGEAMAAL